MEIVLKTVVYGAGSIGCYIGAILHKQNVDVCLLGRERISNLIADNGGIQITDFEGRDDKISDIPFAIEPSMLGEADVILVTLKCTAIDSAIAELKQYANKNSIVICMHLLNALVLSLISFFQDVLKT